MPVLPSTFVIVAWAKVLVPVAAIMIGHAVFAMSTRSQENENWYVVPATSPAVPIGDQDSAVRMQSLPKVTA